MKIKTFVLLATIGCASLAAATDTTTAPRGPQFDPDRHARMTAAREAGDTATMNAIRAEHRAQMQARREAMGKDGQGMGQGKGQGRHGGQNGQRGQGGKGGHGGQCQGQAKTGSN